MKELITKYKEYLKEYEANPANYKKWFDENNNEKEVLFKPTFYDFMSWLIDNEK